MSYKLETIEQSITQLSETYRLLEKIEDMVLIKQRILLCIDDLQNISDSIHQHLDEHR